MPNDATVLRVYLPSPMRENAEAGQVNIINRIAAAIATRGWRMKICNDDQRVRPGFALLHMQEPAAPGVLNLRRAYHYPFWRIEATNARWNFDVAKVAFVADEIDPSLARPFFRRWRERLLGWDQPGRDGFVFMPLQGRLSEHRSFQAMSPLAMIEAVLQREPNRPIRATLHPNEEHPAADHTALAALQQRFPRFSVARADAKALLLACDYVVTQNSSVALSGYFANKPAVLFAGIDFHHIAGSVPRDGIDTAFQQLDGPRPDFARYLFWFFKLHCINGGAPDAEAQILARLIRHGWLN